MSMPLRSEGAEELRIPPESLRTWAGHGTGALCDGCGNSIEAHEIEYEVELPADSANPALHFHLDCYRFWTGRGIR